MDSNAHCETQVVPDTSSTLDDPREHIETISANHMDMCRFKDRFDKDYRNVAAEINSFIASSRQSTYIHLHSHRSSPANDCNHPGFDMNDGKGNAQHQLRGPWMVNKTALLTRLYRLSRFPCI
jgi:hypothetical protein